MCDDCNPPTGVWHRLPEGGGVMRLTACGHDVPLDIADGQGMLLRLAAHRQVCGGTVPA